VIADIQEKKVYFIEDLWKIFYLDKIQYRVQKVLLDQVNDKSRMHRLFFPWLFDLKEISDQEYRKLNHLHMRWKPILRSYLQKLCNMKHDSGKALIPNKSFFNREKTFFYLLSLGW
jgi:hypothetical protein